MPRIIARTRLLERKKLKQVLANKSKCQQMRLNLPRCLKFSAILSLPILSLPSRFGVHLQLAKALHCYLKMDRYLHITV